MTKKKSYTQYIILNESYLKIETDIYNEASTYKTKKEAKDRANKWISDPYQIIKVIIPYEY